jgi:hypothetical protein
MMENRVADFKLLRNCAVTADLSKFTLPPILGPLEEANVRLTREVIGSLDLFSVTVFRDVPFPKDDRDGTTRTVCHAVIAVSKYLSDGKDFVPHTAIKEYLASLRVMDNFGERVKSLMPVVTSVIAGLMKAASVEFERLADATRFFAVTALLAEIVAERKEPTAVEVRNALRRRLILPRSEMGLFPNRSVELIKAACVSDLYIVRNEWRGYARGEIAAIKNVMAGESLKQANKDIQENEQTEITETQQATQTETSEETRTSSELSREVSNLLTASLQANVEGEVTGAFPGGTYRVGGSAEGNIGISVSEKLASRTAQEAVNKALSRVEFSTRVQRTTRDLVRLENQLEYGLNNDGDTNRRGVYRWLDRIERFMVYKIPDRLQLEFQLPNPAEFYKFMRTDAENSQTAMGRRSG